jgi:hypothetical protein
VLGVITFGMGFPMKPFNTLLDYDNTDGNYPGKVRMVENDDGTVRYDVWLHNDTGGALTAGRPYMI